MPPSYRQKFQIIHIKAKLLHELGRHFDSLELYKQLTVDTPKDSEINFEKACVECVIGNRDAAIASLGSFKPTTAKHYTLFGDVEFSGAPVSDIAEKFYSKAHHL